MTTYGTIPTSSFPAAGTPAVNLEYISRAKETITAGLGTCRPWREMFDSHLFGIPTSLADAAARVGTNAAYFRMNYAIGVLAILFLGLMWHPISLVVLAAMMAAWLFLYFLRDKPLVFFGRTVSDSVVLAALAAATIAVLMLTDAVSNIVGALLTGVAAVLIHGAMRKTDDLSVDEEAAGGSLKSSAGPSSSSRSSY
ncbi:hypothetical protein ABFS83_04G095500 [Erythranthe nasuta]